MDKVNLSPTAWLRKNNKYSNTFEDQVCKIADDKRIIEIKKWQVFLNRILAFFKREKPIYYHFIKLKYFERKNEEELLHIFNFEKKKLKIFNEKIIFEIYINAIKENLILI